MSAKAGPKAAADPSQLPLRGVFTAESGRFAAFVDQFVRVPKGTGARGSLRLRPWQVDLVASVLDDPAVRSAGWMLPRGQGKSTLLAALGLHDLLLGAEGASVVVAAVDERQAKIIFSAAVRMTELEPELGRRVQVLSDVIRVPERGATFQVLPAEPKRLEGLDPTLALIDEAGVVARETYEAIALAGGKRERSLLIGIGTPGPAPHEGVLADMRIYGLQHPDDASFVWREHSAAGFENHPPDCAHCWELANPALGDFLHRDAVQALLPPKTREATFRRARLCQLVTDTDGAFLPAGCWDRLATGEGIPDGAEVVLSFDGSLSDDTTALLLATVDAEPHVMPLRVWERPKGAGRDDYRVPIAEVEQTIRDACRRWRVVEVVADPYRWQRSLQVLAAEGLPVLEFPWSPSRITAATSELYQACVNGKLTHSGDPQLAAHVAATVIRQDSRGIRIDKASRSRHARKIDLAAALVQAYSRATWRATRKKRRVRSFAA